MTGITIQELAELMVEIYREEDIPPQLRRDLQALLDEAFSDDGDPGYAWAQPSANVLASAGGRLVCSAGMLEREILVGGGKVLVAGITDVATAASFRGRGCARAVMKAAEEHLKREGRCAFAMLFCNPELAELYERCGYRRVEAPLFIHSEGRRLRIDEIKMALPLAGGEWPAGEIDLLGLPW